MDSLYDLITNKQIPTSVLSDVMDHRGIYGILDHNIRFLNNSKKHFAGQAYTVMWVENRKTREITSKQESTWSQVRDFLVPGVARGEGKGKVYVAGGGNLIKHAALAGGLSSTYFSDLLGFEGMVLGGASRDSDVVKKLSIPVMGTNYIPTDTQGSYRVLEAGTYCTIENVHVRTGDWIVGDEDGVVVIPEEHARSIVDAAINLMESESSVLEKIKAGIPLPQVIDELGCI